MVRRTKPAMITDHDGFTADMEKIAQTLQRWSMGIRTNSPHYWPLVDLHQSVLGVLKSVTGRDPSWSRPHGPLPPRKEGGEFQP